MPTTYKDLSDLIQFIETTEGDLKEIVDQWDTINPGTQPPEFVDLMRNAWEEIKNEHYFEEISKTLSPNKEQFEEVEYGLHKAGLYGDQLKFKLAMHKYYRDRFMAEFPALLNTPVEGRIRDRVKRLLIDLLDLFNLVLTSLKEAIPFVEAIKEFKDLLKKKLSEDL